MDTLECHAREAEDALNGPNTAYDVGEDLVAPVILVAVVDVVKVSDDEENAKKNMQSEEEFVEFLTNDQEGSWQDDAHGDGGNDAPSPVCAGELIFITPLEFVVLE